MHIKRFIGLIAALGFLTIYSVRADVTGTVTIKGTPNSKDETFFAKAANCGESPIRHTENWKIGPKGELADVAVWIIDPQSLPIADYLSQTPSIKQIGCRYDPHVLAVRAGGPIDIINGDPTLHNVRARACDGPGKPPGATIFNFGQVSQGQKDSRQFDQPGLYILQCDVHSWMQCWIMVLPKADKGLPLSWCAVTETDGTFKFPKGSMLADGDYKIDAWHPRFAQPLEQTVHVQKGTATVNFVFDGAKSF